MLGVLLLSDLCDESGFVAACWESHQICPDVACAGCGESSVGVGACRGVWKWFGFFCATTTKIESAINLFLFLTSIHIFTMFTAPNYL